MSNESFQHQTRKIPATVITGFLGSGKTSLIQHLIATANGKRLAFVINEFGDLGVDRELLLGCGMEDCTDEDVVELANGCICCTVADDFLPTMTALLDRADPPDHIIIETSGLALPKPLIKAFAWPEVRTRSTVDGVIAVVDASAVAAGRFATDPAAVQAQREADDSLDHESPLEELFEEQVQCADMVILNKTDCVNEAEWDGIDAMVAEHLRPAVKTLRASHGQIDASVLLGLGMEAEDDLDSRPSHHDDGHEHDHEDFDSFVIDLGETGDADTFLTRLETVIRDHDILRVKGFLAVEGKNMRLAVQAVGGRIQRYFDRDWRGDDVRSSRLVVIGHHGLDETAISTALRD
ncbi:MAG: cobalamin biosynthesis protein CobW [Alphaproteobacteria bacterium]|jgi:cobalamin biosynthesis protein CobW|nr:cobalamin biosynthesis protein CobW [Alphaproteobacteria bacterium]